jgi:hypothetical protein
MGCLPRIGAAESGINTELCITILETGQLKCRRLAELTYLIKLPFFALINYLCFAIMAANAPKVLYVPKSPNTIAPKVPIPFKTYAAPIPHTRNEMVREIVFTRPLEIHSTPQVSDQTGHV